jgi:hypothetical protein
MGASAADRLAARSAGSLLHHTSLGAGPMVNEREISKAFTNFNSAVKKATAAKSQLTNPCDFWKSLKGPWDAVIGALQALGKLIPIAKRAALAMEKVREILNVLCP